MALLGTAFLPAQAADIIKDGKQNAVVITEGGAEKHIQINWAVTELTNWVAKITGAVIPVQSSGFSVQSTDGEAQCPVKIYLGTPELSPTISEFANRHKADFDKIGTLLDGFIIAEEAAASDGKRIYIAAPKTKGVLNGVYRFLEENTDIIWARQYHGDDGCGTIYGKTNALTNKIMYKLDIPSMPWRHWTSAASKNQPIWQARILNNRHMPWEGQPYVVTNKTEDCTYFYRWFTPGLMVRKEHDFRKTDPDIFPLIDGERKMPNDPQLCFSNPKSVKLFAERIAEELSKAPHSLKRIYIAIGDSSETCCCTEYCMKPITLPDGSKLEPGNQKFRTTQFAIFVNNVSKLVREKCPWIDPISAQYYIFTANPPLVEPDGKDGQFCPYIKNHKKPIYDDDANGIWHRDVEGFKAIGVPVSHVYEYYLCARCSRYPHAICEVAQKDLLYYAPYLKEMYNDVPYCDHEDPKDPFHWRESYDASAIEFWVLARLMWNPHQDVKALRREYCRRAYREAGKIMGDYYEKLAEDYNADPTATLWNDDAATKTKYYIVDRGLAGWVRETLAKAEETAVHPGSKELIQRHRQHMLKLIEAAEKMPNRVELAVPVSPGAPDSVELDSPYWKRAARIAPLTQIKNPHENRDAYATMLVTHDMRRLYMLVDTQSPKFLEYYRKAEAEGKLYDKADKNRPFDWGQFEFCIDGKLKEAGTYYFCPFMADGRKIASIGSAPDEANPSLKQYDVKLYPTDHGLKALVSWDLEELGVEITKDQKIGAMFLINWTYMKDGKDVAWNGGYWHAPAAFQTLRLELK